MKTYRHTLAFILLTLLGLPGTLSAQDIVRTGTIVAANCATGAGGVQVDVAGHGAAGFAVYGTFSANIEIQGSVDITPGSLWDNLEIVPLGGGGIGIPISGSIQGLVNTAGLQRVRACASSYTSGTVNILWRVSDAAPRPISTNINQGTVSLFNITPGNSIAARCVDPTGTSYVDCGGSGGGGLTDTELRATPVPISVASLPLPATASTAANQTTGNSSLSSIDAKTPALVGGRQPVDGSGVTQPVSGPVTDAQLRATPVPVSGPVTDAQLRATPVPVSGPLTDAQLRATPAPVSTKTALTANAPATGSVGVASAQLVASNGSRKGLILVNLSSATVCLGIGATAVLNSGICLQSGAAFYMNEYNLVTGTVNAIASGAASAVSVQEFQ